VPVEILHTEEVKDRGEEEKGEGEEKEDDEKEAIIGIGDDEAAIIKRQEEEYRKCMNHCKELKKIIDDRKASINYDFELLNTAKLIELLETVILNPSKNWKQNMIRLVEIPYDVKGGRLSGPSYFEAFFQIAFYLGIFTGISEYNREFYNKDGGREENFLYVKDVNASGGKEHGISDITFKLRKDPISGPVVSSYVCGEKPEEPMIDGDITYFISVKRFTQERSAKYYDIGDLYTYIGKKHPGAPFNLCICCRNRGEFLKRMTASKSDYLTTSVDKLYGFDDTSDKENPGLLQVFERYRSSVFSNMAPIYKNVGDKEDFNVKEWITKHIPEKVPVKPALSLYFHQELIVESVIHRINEQKTAGSKDNYVCVGVLPRGGKSYIAGGIINRMIQPYTRAKPDERFWVLFMTSAISETISQFEQDLISKFSDFNSFDFIDLRKIKKTGRSSAPVETYRQKIERRSAKPHSFVFVSRELLTGKDKISEADDQTSIKPDVATSHFREIFKALGYGEGEKVPFNLVMFDEAHKGGITKLTKAALYKHITGSPPFILMTATYKKLVDSENGFIHIDKDLFIWDLDDIQLMKKLPSLGTELFYTGVKDEDGTVKPFNLFNRYTPELIKHLINRRISIGETLESITKPYESFPTPYFLSATFSPGVITKLSGENGFNIQSHFELKNPNDPGVKELLEDTSKINEWHNALANPAQAIALRNYLTPHEPGSIEEKDKVLNRIFSITQTTMGIQARPSYGTPFSILMFLPTGKKDSRIGATCRAWGSLLLQSNYWADNFIVLGLSEFHLDKRTGSKSASKALSVAPEAPPHRGPLEPIEEGSHEGGSMYSLSVLHGGSGKSKSKASGIHVSSCLSKEPLDGFCSEDNIPEKDLKSKIVALERAALKERKGLVILTGNRAAMGISLPCVDLVCLFDDDKEADMIIQKMYRALTDSPGKKYGFIFDFNLRRIFRAKFAYANTINLSHAGSRESVPQMAEHTFSTCLWDRDAWNTKLPTETFNDYMSKIKEQLLGNIVSEAYKIYEKELDTMDLRILDSGPNLSSEMISILSGTPISKTTLESKTYQAPGINAPPAPSVSEHSDEEEEEEEEEDKSSESTPEAESESKIQITKENIVKITKQFVNLLYIRDDEIFSKDTNKLEKLLEKYDDDKDSTDIDTLLTTDYCKTPSNNLYVRIIHDIQTLIPIPSLKDDKGIPYVGPSTKASSDLERYSYIPPMTEIIFTVTLSDDTKKIHKAVYHPYASKSINKWAEGVYTNIIKKGLATRSSSLLNIFTDKRITAGKPGGALIPLGRFIDVQKGLGPLPELSELPENKQGSIDRTIRVLDFIRSRFDNAETLLNYTNYLEAFMSTVTKQPPPIQTGGGESSTARLNTILQVIDDHLVPDDVARKERGEIFTPPHLVREMLFGLDGRSIFGLDSDEIMFINGADESKRSGGLPEEVWKNPNLKWLDPANGIGNFPIIAFYKLDFMLKGIGRKKIGGREVNFSDPDARRKHIIENMLYMIELDRGNNETAKGLFKKIHKGAKPNILCGNTLLMTYEDIKKGFGVNKFDIIMGNPPFNPPKGDTGSSGNSIWQNFVMKSFYMLNPKGYLVFVHPPGWKKPTDDVFKPDTIADGNNYKIGKDGKVTMVQIRSGQVWQVLKPAGVFKFIYTNDQKTTAVGNDYLPHFPAVDYYVYQKDGEKAACGAKNVFLGKIEDAKGVRLNYNLKYLPNLITKQTQDILHKVTSKEGKKPEFSRGIDERGITWTGKTIDWLYDSKKSVFQYKKHGIKASTKTGDTKDTVNINKVVVNFGGGIDAYIVKYVSGDDEIGVLDMTMYSKVESDKEGKRLEAFFKSDIVKFIFLITQYASGKMTKNEPLVANSITIPSEGTTDYYKFFGIEEHKKYIEDTLAHYDSFNPTKKHTGTKRASRKGASSTASKKAPRKGANTVSKKAKLSVKRKGGGHTTRRQR